MPDMMLWAAGLFEGEGSIMVRRKKGRLRVYPELELQMTCSDVVARFHEVVQCGYVRSRPARQEGWKLSVAWKASSARDVERLLTAFLPYLGVKKTSEAHAALQACARVGVPMKERTHCVNGHEYTPENTGYMVCKGVRQRRCLACKREGRRSVPPDRPE